MTKHYTASWDSSVTLHTFLAVLHIWIILIFSSHNALECLSLWSIHTTIMKFIMLKQYLRTVHILWKKNQLFIVWRLVSIVSIHVDRASASFCSQYHVQVFLQLATSRVRRCKKYKKEGGREWKKERKEEGNKERKGM